MSSLPYFRVGRNDSRRLSRTVAKRRNSQPLHQTTTVNNEFPEFFDDLYQALGAALEIKFRFNPAAAPMAHPSPYPSPGRRRSAKLHILANEPNSRSQTPQQPTNEVHD